MNNDLKFHIIRLLQTITNEEQINSSDIKIFNNKAPSSIALPNDEYLVTDCADNRIIHISLKKLVASVSISNYNYNAIIESAVLEYWKEAGLSEYLLSAINQISALYHESEVAYGKILFDKHGDSDTIGCNVEFLNKHNINRPENVKLIRKLLNLTDKENALIVSKNGEICGIKRLANLNVEDYIEISINGFMNWEFSENGLAMFLYSKGNYRVNIASKTQEKILKKFSQWFDPNQNHSNSLNLLINKARKQRHGTSLIIGPKEEMLKEARRLCSTNRGTRVKINLKDNIEYIELLTSIDGALIIDNDLECLAIGVILDGDAKTTGNTSRGARYNSICNYIACLKRRDRKEQNDIRGQSNSVIGIIFSEDKAVDVITSDDFGDIQGLAIESVAFTLDTGKFKRFAYGKECNEHKMDFNEMTDEQIKVIEEYSSSISLYNFDDPTSRKLDGTYVFINLIQNVQDNISRKDWRLVYDFAEITLRKIGNGECVFQIMEVESTIRGFAPGGSGIKNGKLFGKNAYRTINKGNGELIKLKIAYAYNCNGPFSVRFNNFEDYLGCERIEMFENQNETAYKAIIDLLNFTFTRYHIRLNTPREVFNIIFSMDINKNTRTMLKEVVDQDSCEDKYEKIVYEK